MNLVNYACERLLLKLSLFNAHAMVLFFHIYTNVNNLCLSHTLEPIHTIPADPNTGTRINRCDESRVTRQFIPRAHTDNGASLTRQTHKKAWEKKEEVVKWIGRQKLERKN